MEILECSTRYVLIGYQSWEYFIEQNEVNISQRYTDSFQPPPDDYFGDHRQRAK